MNPLDATYRFVRKGRSWSTLIAVGVTWLFCIVAVVLVQAAWWLVGIILLFTFPALWDLWSGRQAGAELTSDKLTWYSGRRVAEVDLIDIDHVRFVTRLDLTVRAAVVMVSGRKLRLPQEATPPVSEFEAALSEHGIRSERHHFTFL